MGDKDDPMLSLADKMLNAGIVSEDEVRYSKQVQSEIREAESRLAYLEKIPAPKRKKEDNRRINALQGRIASLQSERIARGR